MKNKLSEAVDKFGIPLIEGAAGDWEDPIKNEAKKSKFEIVDYSGEPVPKDAVALIPSTDALKKYINKESGVIGKWVADVGGKVVGISTLEDASVHGFRYNSNTEVIQVFVSPKARGMGVGEALIKEAYANKTTDHVAGYVHHSDAFGALAKKYGIRDMDDVSNYDEESDNWQEDGTYKDDMDEGLKGDWEKEGYTLRDGEHEIAPSEYIPSVEALFNGKVVGHVAYQETTRGVYSRNTEVKSEHQRKGLATAMYKYIEKKTGRKMHRSGMQTDAARSLWAQPNKVFGEGAAGDWEKEGYIIHRSDLNPNDSKAWDAIRKIKIGFEIYKPEIDDFYWVDGNHVDEYLPGIKSGKYKIGSIAPFIWMSDKNGNPVGGVVAQKDGEILHTKVLSDHQRKGIASAMYSCLEKILKTKVHGGMTQTDDAKKLWSKPNRPFGEDEDDDIQNGFIEDKSKEPEFFFGRDGINDWQHSYKGSDKDIFQIGQYRSGHPYTFLPHRIKFYVEKFGSPDFIHVISNKKSNALKAVYAEHGKDMVQLWSFVNIRQEPGWKAFEKAAHDAGYNIKDFSKGRVDSSHGYWLDEDIGSSLWSEFVKLDNAGFFKEWFKNSEREDNFESNVLGDEDFDEKAKERFAESEDISVDDVDINSKKFKEFLKDEIESAAQDWYDDRWNELENDMSDKLKFGKHGVKIYRAITVEDPDEFIFHSSFDTYINDHNGVGVYWAWDEDSAEAHWGHGKGKEIVIHAEAPLSSIGIKTTLMLNMNPSLGRDEAELRLKEKAKVFVLGFEVGGEFILVDKEPLQLTASLSEQYCKFGMPLVENLHSQYSNQLECGKDKEWNNIKETSNYSKKCLNLKDQKSITMESLSGTLSNFVVVNQQEMIPKINKFFMDNKNMLSENLKNKLSDILSSGNMKYIDQYGSIPKFDKKESNRKFEVKLKFQTGFSEDSIRVIFIASEYEISDTLILEFKKINFRKDVYKEESLNEMRTKMLKVDGKEVESILMAGGFGAKIYSAGENLVLVKGRKQTVVPDTDPKFKTIINYVNLKYMPLDQHKDIQDKFKELLSEELSPIMLPDRLPNYRTLQGYPKKKKLEANDSSIVHLSKDFEEFLKQVIQLKHDNVDKISIIEKYHFPKSKSIAADIEVKYKDGEEHVYHIDYNGINFSWMDFGINVDLGVDIQEAISGFMIMLDEKVPHQELVKK